MKSPTLTHFWCAKEQKEKYLFYMFRFGRNMDLTVLGESWHMN